MLLSRGHFPLFLANDDGGYADDLQSLTVQNFINFIGCAQPRTNTKPQGVDSLKLVMSYVATASQCCWRPPCPQFIFMYLPLYVCLEDRDRLVCHFCVWIWLLLINAAAGESRPATLRLMRLRDTSVILNNYILIYIHENMCTGSGIFATITCARGFGPKVVHSDQINYGERHIQEYWAKVRSSPDAHNPLRFSPISVG